MKNNPIKAADGTDITEAVQILYDIAHQSMDWGSGFLDQDEMVAVIGLAVHMGWTPPKLPYGRSLLASSIAKKFPEHYLFVPWSDDNPSHGAFRPIERPTNE